MPEGQSDTAGLIKTIKKLIIAVVVIAVLFIGYILLTRVHDNRAEKEYKKEMKILAKQLDSLRQSRDILEAEQAEILTHLDGLNVEKREILSRIENLNSQLKTINKKYEKINTYTGISDDSLRRIFAERFNK